MLPFIGLVRRIRKRSSPRSHVACPQFKHGIRRVSSHQWMARKGALHMRRSRHPGLWGRLSRRSADERRSNKDTGQHLIHEATRSMAGTKVLWIRGFGANGFPIDSSAEPASLRQRKSSLREQNQAVTSELKEEERRQGLRLRRELEVFLSKGKSDSKLCAFSQGTRRSVTVNKVPKPIPKRSSSVSNGMDLLHRPAAPRRSALDVHLSGVHPRALGDVDIVAKRNLPFVCTLYFVAAGGEFGDIVELTFLNFQIGSLELDSKILSAVRGEAASPHLASLYDGSDGEPEFGYFCGDMATNGGSGTGGSATFFSDRNNVTLVVTVPSRASLHMYSFSMYLTFRFHPKRPSRTRYGTSASPHDIGMATAGTYCDRVFEHCDRKRCKIRSPNFPGFYLRNFTCTFTIRQMVAPPGKQAQIVLYQDNEYKISIFTGRRTATTFSPRSLTTDCLGDVVKIYDGPSADHSPLLTEFCGTGVLPEVISSGPEVTVVLRSVAAQQMHSSRLELEVKVRFVDVKEYKLGHGRCEFHVDGKVERQGLVHTPAHTVPPNTTCRYRFHGRSPTDRVWLYFLSYFVEDKHRWSSEEKCDLSSIDLFDVPLLRPGSNTTADASNTSASGDIPGMSYRFCEKNSPRICARAAEYPNFIPLRPCRYPDESYLSSGAELVLEQKFYKTIELPVRRSFFSARYEFVDTEQQGTDMGPRHGPCHRHFQSSNSKFGMVSSSKNVFLYGRGGRENVTCSYYYSGMTSEKLRLYLVTLNLPALGCEHYFDQVTQRYNCRVTGRQSGRISLLHVMDHWSDTYTPIGCFCNITSQPRKPILIESVGNNVTLTFTVSGMTALEDFNNYGFEATYEFRPATSCDTSTELRNGSQGELTFTAPASVTGQELPLRCRWFIEASPRKYLYLKFQGRDGSRGCPDSGNRFVVYADGIVQPVAVVCSGGVHEETSLSTDFDIFSASWYNESSEQHALADRVVIETVAFRAAQFQLRWLEVTRPFLKTSSGLTLRNVNCLHECPELSACISPELWCDGIVHCPSGHDEKPEHCRRFPTFYVALGAGAGFVVICACLTALLLWCRSKDKSKEEPRLRPADDMPLESPDS
ncbi:hypothetical protein HPB51_009943 [Rhipicephalus microplus]|uniref:CUB domain-containing protein n=1 Tax=Rhipicephalus microplus TaxID=6941 RepID=A0A9J6ET57_RHIMP|nr:hypothetical protein HPB51_009943 [Rhipicephalus microplus]